jgi:phosphoribosyl 1,2-cyclic phosphate phosphodiesterase
MKVTFLGTGTSVGVPAITCRCEVCTSTDPLNRRLRTSALLSVGETRLLLDASIDLRQQALREGIDRLDAVLLTHGHADHVFGLDDLRMFNYRQQAPVPVYGSATTLRDVRRTYWYVFEDPGGASSRPQMDLRPVGGSFLAGGLPVTPLEVLHGTIPILGYRLGAFAYITDASALPDATFESLRDLDVLVINALRRKAHPTHFTLDRALEAIARIAPRRQAWLTHISHDLEHAALSAELPRGVSPAHDGLTIEVDDP